MSLGIDVVNKSIEMKGVTTNKEIYISSCACTGGDDSNNYLYNRLKEYFEVANQIDIIVSFLMVSGIKLIIRDLKKALDRGAEIRILTGSYLGITEPEALYILKNELGEGIKIHFYNEKGSFHPKAYIFYSKNDATIFVGSSNISKGALTNAIEWNYKFKKREDEKSFSNFTEVFENLFDNHSIKLTDEVLALYNKNWKKPKSFYNLTLVNDNENTNNDIKKFEPKGSQIPILYQLEKTRGEGFTKGLVVAATGVGKTYLSAFDSIDFDRILFIAHREEIIRQAMLSFQNVRKDNTMGYFYGDIKERNTDIIFALVQTLGKKEYLNESYFSKKYFDYIVIDEFHHASSRKYQQILDYFEPKFLLGLTATPERLDGKDILGICDYNLVYEIGLKEAINKGDLVPFRYYGIYDCTVNYDNIKEVNGKLDGVELEKALMIEKRTELILGNYNKYNSKASIGFCSSRKHAENMAKIFNEAGIKALAVYSGEQGVYTEDRTSALRKLKSGEINVLFTVDMFNEGVDIPNIDLVMFLRPTESPTVFLQQLGRGLRKYQEKEYLIVLDFVGNYKKANLIPFLLSGKKFNNSELKNKKPNEFEYPDECIVDFDFQLVNLFKKIAEKNMKLKDLINQEFKRVYETLGERPTRVELFREMDAEVYKNMRSKAKENVFKNYIKYLEENKLLTLEEKLIRNSIAYDFINMIETTSMSKSYKLPVFLAFYNNGNFKTRIDDEDLYRSFKSFYNVGSNKVDLIKDKGKENFKSWKKANYVDLARKNPVKFLCGRQNSVEGMFFYIDNNANEMCIRGLDEFKSDKQFLNEVKDAINFRKEQYYNDRFELSYKDLE
ncbi:MAG: DEAD/DEAH box helicase family protein [Sarcina sp.]